MNEVNVPVVKRLYKLPGPRPDLVYRPSLLLFFSDSHRLPHARLITSLSCPLVNIEPIVEPPHSMCNVETTIHLVISPYISLIL